MLEKIFSRRNFIKMTTAALVLMTTNFSSTVQAAKPCRIRTRQGIYDGFVDKHGIQTWLSIPYAQPPVKNLRWLTSER